MGNRVSTLSHADKCYFCERLWGNDGHTFRTKDHIIPLSMGGRDCIENKIFCCARCNHLKSNGSVAEFIIKIKEKPIKMADKVIMIRNCFKLMKEILPIQKKLQKDGKQFSIAKGLPKVFQ